MSSKDVGWSIPTHIFNAQDPTRSRFVLSMKHVGIHRPPKPKIDITSLGNFKTRDDIIDEKYSRDGSQITMRPKTIYSRNDYINIIKGSEILSNLSSNYYQDHESFFIYNLDFMKVYVRFEDKINSMKNILDAGKSYKGRINNDNNKAIKSANLLLNEIIRMVDKIDNQNRDFNRDAAIAFGELCKNYKEQFTRYIDLFPESKLRLPGICETMILRAQSFAKLAAKTL